MLFGLLDITRLLLLRGPVLNGLQEGLAWRLGKTTLLRAHLVNLFWVDFIWGVVIFHSLLLGSVSKDWESLIVDDRLAPLMSPILLMLQLLTPAPQLARASRLLRPVRPLRFPFDGSPSARLRMLRLEVVLVLIVPVAAVRRVVGDRSAVSRVGRLVVPATPDPGQVRVSRTAGYDLHDDGAAPATCFLKKVGLRDDHVAGLALFGVGRHGCKGELLVCGLRQFQLEDVLRKFDRLQQLRLALVRPVPPQRVVPTRQVLLEVLLDALADDGHLQDLIRVGSGGGVHLDEAFNN